MACNIFLHTSIHESFCMVLVEWMALSLPVIAGKDSGGPEWILKNGGGLLVNVTKVDDIKQALRRLFDSEYHQQLSLKAREVALSRFTKKRWLASMLMLIKIYFIRRLTNANESLCSFTAALTLTFKYENLTSI